MSYWKEREKFKKPFNSPTNTIPPPRVSRVNKLFNFSSLFIFVSIVDQSLPTKEQSLLWVSSVPSLSRKSMSSIMNSQGVVLATAMAAVSGTVVLLALRLQKSFPATQSPRPCLCSDGKRREKKKKRVHFAQDVVDPIGNSEDFRRQRSIASNFTAAQKRSKREMPGNRAALYNGILRDRLVHHRSGSYAYC